MPDGKINISLEKQVSVIAEDVTKIKDALLGTEYSKGMVRCIDDHERRIRRMERAYAIGLGIVIIGSFIIQYIWRP